MVAGEEHPKKRLRMIPYGLRFESGHNFEI